jgi:hypothetical protein
VLVAGYPTACCGYFGSARAAKTTQLLTYGFVERRGRRGRLPPTGEAGLSLRAHMANSALPRADAEIHAKHKRGPATFPLDNHLCNPNL